jgi:anti-anti-sigma regulatory factor
MDGTDSTYAPTTDLTIFEAVDFRNRLVTLLSQEGPVTVDLSKVHQIDSSCIQILLAARRSGRLTVAGASETFRLKAMQLGCPELAGH